MESLHVLGSRNYKHLSELSGGGVNRDNVVVMLELGMK